VQRVRELTDLVEEQRAVMRGLDQTPLGGARIGEGATLEAEQLGLQEGLGNRRTVDVDERTASARPRAVKQIGDQPLARARLS
jgi:hypothetical protein